MLNTHELIFIPILEGKKIVLRIRAGVATPTSPPTSSLSCETGKLVLKLEKYLPKILIFCSAVHFYVLMITLTACSSNSLRLRFLTRMQQSPFRNLEVFCG